MTAYAEVERGRYQPRDGIPFAAYVKGIAHNKIREARRRCRRYILVEDVAEHAAMRALPGLGVAVIGIDTQTGVLRLTFGDVHLCAALDVLVAIVGLFALCEVFIILEHRHGGAEADSRKIKIGRLTPPISMLNSSSSRLLILASSTPSGTLTAFSVHRRCPA